MKLQTGVIAAAAAGAGYLAWKRLQPKHLDLHGKTVLITGGSRGLGVALAREFGAQGASNIAICARDEAELNRAQQDLTERNIPTQTAVCDVTDQGQVEAMIRRIGAVDVLVNNAGLIRVGPFSDMTLTDFEQAMDVMFWGSLYTTMAVFPAMRERKQGSIVNITSIGGKVSVPHLLPYSCAKFAAVALSEGLRAELAPDGIRVTTIVPGLMRTGSHLKAEFKGKHKLEYIWFSAGAGTSVVSISAEDAARSIVRATIRGDAEKILSLPAQLLARAHALYPELSLRMLSIVNRLLPSASGNLTNSILRGAEVQSQLNSGFWSAMIEPGQMAAKSLNQLSTV
jgi:short-subunit dehydrogenase